MDFLWCANRMILDDLVFSSVFGEYRLTSCVEEQPGIDIAGSATRSDFFRELPP